MAFDTLQGKAVEGLLGSTNRSFSRDVITFQNLKLKIHQSFYPHQAYEVAFCLQFYNSIAFFVNLEAVATKQASDTTLHVSVVWAFASHHKQRHVNWSFLSLFYFLSTFLPSSRFKFS